MPNRVSILLAHDNFDAAEYPFDNSSFKHERQMSWQRRVVLEVHRRLYLVALLLELLDEGGVLDSLAGLAGDVVDAGLVLLHAGDVVLQARLLLPALGRVVAQQVCQLLPVLTVLVDAELQVLAKVLQEEDTMLEDGQR